jgi:hypothetical protein
MKSGYSRGETSCDDNQVKEVPAVCSERLEAKAVKPYDQVKSVEEGEKEEDTICLGVGHYIIGIVFSPEQLVSETMVRAVRTSEG